MEDGSGGDQSLHPFPSSVPAPAVIPVPSPVSPVPESEWWSTYFDERYLLEYEPLFDLARNRREVGRLMELLELPVAARILDCPCGQGRHAHLLAEAGYDVDGVDYSRELLARAKERGIDNTLRFTRGDMRSLPRTWTRHFDAVVNLFTSFGFFVDPRDDAKVISEFARVLKPGGVLIWHGASRDGVAARIASGYTPPLDSPSCAPTRD